MAHENNTHMEGEPKTVQMGNPEFCWNCVVSINPRKNVLMIDLSYYVFYRYYSTYNWLKKYQKSEVTKDEILKEPLFLEKYSKIFERTLCDIVKQSNVTWTNVFLVKDCMRENIWRNDHYKNYKATRDERLDTFNKDIFWITYNELIPKLKNKYNFQVISHDRLEADDVIAIMKTELRMCYPDIDITIITNDNDYIQLVDSKTVIRNLQGKEIIQRVSMEPALYLKTKIIMGDKSDNIPCIMKKVGPKTAEKLAVDDENFEKFCVKNSEARKQYELNKLLIDLSCIPDEFRNAFKSRLVYL